MLFRRRPRTRPGVQAQPPYQEWCWLRHPVRQSELAPIRLAVEQRSLAIEATPEQSWVPIRQDISRLVRLRDTGPEVEAVFVDAEHSIVIVHTVHVSAEASQGWVQRLLEAYRTETGEPFPTGWQGPLPSVTVAYSPQLPPQ